MGETTTRNDEVVEFLHDVRHEGLISDFMAETLLDYRARQTGHLPPQPATHPAFAPVVAPVPEPPSSRPYPTPEPPPQPAAPAVPAPRRRTRTEIWARYARQRSKKMWGTLSADFAANALTYLGVLLAVVVIFVFFAFGYFAEFIDADHKEFRPLAEAGVVAFFLGLAWVLRHRTGIPQTSAAIEMIGIVLIPVMMSASFRDGCTPSYRPWCLPPDVDGPARWAAYGVVALISTAIYYVYSRRRNIYSYLVGPMLWVAVGAFALYLDDGIRQAGSDFDLGRFTSDGISAVQLIAVMTAMGLSVAVAARFRHHGAFASLAMPIVRSAVFTAPFVLAGSLVFAYNDAVVRGIAEPALGDMAWPTVIATAMGAVVFLTASRSSFAWAGLTDKLRSEITTGLRLAGRLSLAASWLLTAGLGVTTAWLGAGLFGYALLLAVVDRAAEPAQGPWLVRLAALVGLTLALIDPGPATLTWGTGVALLVLRSTTPAVASVMGRYVAVPDRENDQRLQLGLVVLIAIAAGPARLVGPELTPLVLLVAAGSLAGARHVADRHLRFLSGIPAVTLAGGAVGTEVWHQVLGTGLESYPLSLFLGAAAMVVYFTTIPMTARLGVSSTLFGLAAGIALRELVGTDLWATTWIDTAILGVLGIALVTTAAMRSSASRSASILGHVFVAAALVRSLPFEETVIVGLTAVLVAYGFEAIRIELGRRSIFSDVGWLPATVALVALIPLTVVTGRQIRFFTDEVARFGPLLSGLSWLYVCVAVPEHRGIRMIAVPLAWVVAFGGIALAIPSVTAALIAASSAALLTAVVAAAAQRPQLTIVSWTIGLAGVVLAASRFGVAPESLHLVLHLAALAMVLVGAAAMTSRWSAPALVVGAAALPVALAAADGSWTAWLAFSAAGAYAWLGWRTGIGAASLPTAAGVAIGYAAVLEDNGWADVGSEPLLWMPLAAVLVASSAVLPGSRGWRLIADAAPGAFLSGLALGGFVLGTAADRDIALVCIAILFIEAYLIRRDELWLGGAATSLLVAGLIAGGFWAPLATLLLSVVLATLADRHRADDRGAPLRVMAAASFAATVTLAALWLAWDARQVIAATAGAAGVLLVAAVAAELLPALPTRLRLWRTQVFWLGQAGALAAIGLADRGLSMAAAAGVTVGIVAGEALLAGVVGTIRRSTRANIGSAFLAAAAYSQLPIWLEWSRDEKIATTSVVAVALAMVATMATRGRGESAALASWTTALHGITAAAATAVLAEAFAAADAEQNLWIAAAVLVGIGAHLAANAWAAPRDLPIRGFAVASALGGALCAGVAAAATTGQLLAVALATAGTGLVVAIGAGSIASTDAAWRRELVVLFAGLEIISVGVLLQQFAPLDSETGMVLIVAGAAPAAYGVLARHLEVVELALVAWLGALLILVNDQVGLSLHSAVLTASVALLGGLELERLRYEIDDAVPPAWVDQAEWLLMLAPITLAAAAMFNQLWFGLVLFSEGLVLAAWGTATQIRRRAFTGVVAMVLAIVLSVMLPAVHGLMAGLAAGTWLAVGAVAAVVFIAAGSAIERQRHALGRRLARLGQIVDSWD